MLPLSACGAEPAVGGLQTIHESVEHGTAPNAGVLIDMATGQLDLSDGSNKLMEGTFQYNVPNWKPKINYNGDGTPGVLSIVQPVDRNNLPASNGSTVYNWEIRLGNQVPLDLELHLGLGEARLDLSNLQISALKMELGAGKVDADLTGDYGRDVDAQITGGTGQITLKVGHHMATRIEVKGKLGKVTASGLSRDGEAYTNGVRSTNRLSVMIDSGVGEIKLEGR
jgi:hypothetical protein